MLGATEVLRSVKQIAQNVLTIKALIAETVAGEAFDYELCRSLVVRNSLLCKRIEEIIEPEKKEDKKK